MYGMKERNLKRDFQMFKTKGGVKMEIIVLSKEQFKEELMNAWIAGLSCNDKDSNCYVDKRIAKVKFSRFV